MDLVSSMFSFSSLSFGFGYNFSTHWATHYVYLFDENGKCILGLAMSSAHDYKLKDLLRDIEYDVFKGEAAGEEYLNDNE